MPVRAAMPIKAAMTIIILCLSSLPCMYDAYQGCHACTIPIKAATPTKADMPIKAAMPIKADTPIKAVIGFWSADYTLIEKRLANYHISLLQDTTISWWPIPL